MPFWKQKPKRRVFGFPCTEDISTGVRITARKLRVPIYAAAEHLLQCGGAQLAAIFSDEQFRQEVQEALPDWRMMGEHQGF